MGIISKIGNAVKNAYNKVDQKVGGYLPGGSTPQQVSQSKSSSSPASSSASAAPTNSTSTSSQNKTVSSSGSRSSGGSSSGGSSISLPSNLTQQSSTQLPYQTRGTATDLAPQVPSSVKNVNVSATYGSGSSGSKPASAPATGASGSALNQGGGPASPSSSGSSGGSGAVMTAASGNINIGPEYDPRRTMTAGEKYASIDKNLFGGLLPGGTKLSRDSISAGVENLRDAAQQATGTGPYSSPKPITAFTKLIDPLDVLKNPMDVGEIRGPSMGGTYTGQYNPATGQYDVPDAYKGKTGYENAQLKALMNPEIAKTDYSLSDQVQKQVIGELKPQFESRASDIAAGYQAKINAGQLTVEQATPMYKADIASLQTQFQSQAQQRYDEILTPKIQAAQAFRGELANLRQDVFMNPSTLISGVALIGASFGGGSSVAAIRAASGAANALIAVEGASNVGEGISNKNYVQAALGAAAFGLGTYGALRYAANEVTIAQIEGATSKTPRVLYGSRTELRENYFQDIYKYQQATSSAKAVTRETVFSEFNPQTNTFKIVSGSSETTVRTTDFWSGRSLYVGSYRTFTGSGMVLPKGTIGAQANVPGISVSTEGFTPSISQVTTTQQYSYRFFDSLKSTPAIRSGGPVVTQIFGGEAKLQDQFIFSKSGAIQQLPYTKIQGEGFTALQQQTGIYKIDTFSILKFKSSGSPTDVYFEPFSNTGLRGNFPSSGSGLASVQAQSAASIVPAQSAASIVPGISVASLGAEQTLKSATQAITSSATAENIFAASSARSASLYAGTGQYERTQQYQIFAPALTQQNLQGFMQPPIVDMLPGIDQRGGQIPTLSPALAQTPMIDQLQSPALQQDFNFPGITPASGVPFNPFIDIDLVGPGLPSLKGFEAGELGMGPIPKGKQRLKYTPDFEALVFGIKGKAPRGGEAPNPFASRPITKGFSFAFSEGPSFGDMFKDIQDIGRPKRRRK